MRHGWASRRAWACGNPRLHIRVLLARNAFAGERIKLLSQSQLDNEEPNGSPRHPRTFLVERRRRRNLSSKPILWVTAKDCGSFSSPPEL